MRIRLEGFPQRYHEDHNAAKGTNSLSHYNLMKEVIDEVRNEGRKFILRH